MRFILGICLILASFTCQADWKDWDSTDKQLFVVSETSLFADWMQTKKIAENPNRWSETNPIIGVHPSVGRVNTYFLSAMIGNYFLADYLGENRRLYLGVIALGEGLTVKHNLALGLSVGF